MKNYLVILFALITICVSFNSSAQSISREDFGEDIPLDLQAPTPKRIMGSDGVQFVFTAKQYQKLTQIINAYDDLGTLAVKQEQKIIALNLQVVDLQKEIYLCGGEALSASLQVQIRDYKLQIDKLNDKLSKNKKRNFLRTLGVSTLMGISFGLVGVAVGKSLP